MIPGTRVAHTQRRLNAPGETRARTREGAPEREKPGKQSAQPPLKAARRPDPNQRAHQEPQIQRRRVNQDALQDVRSSTQVHSAEPPGFVGMSEGSLQTLATL